MEEDKKTPFFKGSFWNVPKFDDIGIGGYLGSASSIISMIGENMLKDYEQDFEYNPSPNQYVDVESLEGQQFQRSPFKWTNIAKGAAAGAALGGWGAVGGGAVGLGTAIWDWADQSAAKADFEQKKNDALKDARQRNYVFGTEQKDRKVGAASVNEQIKNFYKNIPF